LPALDSITGCDTSAFFKIGKVTPFNLLFKYSEKFNLSEFGKCSVGDSLQLARKFINKLYDCEKEDSLDKSSIKLTMNTKKPASELPPTEDAFYQHILRYYLLDFLKYSWNLYFYVDLITSVTYGSTVTFLWSTN
jgi:hypothetical protein